MERVNENEKEYRRGKSGVKYLFRGPRIDWGVLLLLPGEKMGAHGHREVEETFYFTSGTPKMIVDGGEYRVREGDAFRIEPGEVHNVINTTDRPLDGIFIKHAYRPDDKVSAED
mgnify:CR=1 FL=1